jgi:GNAT superfamily N-acetyltransferase
VTPKRPRIAAIARLQYRELNSSPATQGLLAAFYERLYVPEFPDRDERESLESIRDYLARKAAGWYGDNNYHVVVACDGDEPVGGVIFDYLAEAEAGVAEFLVVDRAWRGRGLGTALLAYLERTLADDAAARGRRPPRWLVAEMNDPFWPEPVEDSLDPFVRAAIWGRWGFHRLLFPYVQPALAADKRPVHHLMLAIKFLTGAVKEVGSATVVRAVHEYVRWAMRITEPERSPQFRAMAEHLARVPVVETLALTTYVGRDPERPIDVSAVATATDRDLEAVLAVYRRAFPSGPTTIDTDRFARTLALTSGRRDRRYHLWALRLEPGARVEGMASFFTFPEGGFGGYVALVGALRGTGRARLLVARIEEQMVRDGLGARGWYVECGPDSHAARSFVRAGFHELALPYRQPALGPGAAESPVRLLYKEFGARGTTPNLAGPAIRAALRRIGATVYDLDGATLEAWLARSGGPNSGVPDGAMG